MIEIARKKYPDIDFSCMEAEDLTFDEPFDYIILSNTIGYLEDIQGVFAGLMKVCHQHTKVIVTYYNFSVATGVEHCRASGPPYEAAGTELAVGAGY